MTHDPACICPALDSVVANYVEDDVRFAGLPTDVQNAPTRSMTLAGVDLALVPDVTASLDSLVVALADADQAEAAVARSYTQAYQNVFAPGVPEPYLDLGHLAEMLSVEVRSEDVFDAARRLLAVLDQAVIAEKHGTARSGSTGLTVYFPNSVLYGLVGSGSATYSSLADRYAAETLWDDHLTSTKRGCRCPPRAQGPSPSSHPTRRSAGLGSATYASRRSRSRRTSSRWMHRRYALGWAAQDMDGNLSLEYAVLTAASGS